MKRATFIGKNCELLQEFSFAHPITKMQTISLYNCHFSGSQLWDLFGDEVTMLENSWNILIRKVYDLPITTHRWLIEPISKIDHLRKQLLKQYLSFLTQVENSSKYVARQLLH